MAGWHNSIASDLPEAHRAFSSLEQVWALQGKIITTSSLCTVLRVELDGKGYYVKRYGRAGDGLARCLGKSKARREWENLLRFKSWGLSVANVVAYGEERVGWSRKGALITAEVPGSTDLAALAAAASPLLRSADWVASVSDQVAHASAVMHQHQFAHNDWKLRNILVSGPEHSPLIHMIDCPAGAFWWGPFFEYRRIKDIACLDKIGKKVLSRSQRLRFYFQYVGAKRLTKKDKRDIRKILKFFDGRE
ncbi:heptose kinase [Aestuariicella hydrocarbonica]|uniref:Heptose kinase n=1 Tax=Pseudomaricurvus hydrocarbonicus TaxID=1470433 RepID=A0A9E5MM81_9GAMM|nr:lipopolysaccharide kinase InaA family protein [Aestuariicella hydrocarbonica]NHO66548.1 heptose kinase [Aestuariicella hydrocarbonica]